MKQLSIFILFILLFALIYLYLKQASQIPATLDDREQKEQAQALLHPVESIKKDTRLFSPQKISLNESKENETDRRQYLKIKNILPKQPKNEIQTQDSLEVPSMQLLIKITTGTVVEFLQNITLSPGIERMVYQAGKQALKQSGSLDLQSDTPWNPMQRITRDVGEEGLSCEFIMPGNFSGTEIRIGQKAFVKQKQIYQDEYGEGIYIRLMEPFPIHTIMCENKRREDYTITYGDLKTTTGNLFRFLKPES